MKTGRLYCLSVLQIVGLGLQFWSMEAGSAVILGGCIGQILSISKEVLEQKKYKSCPKCGASVLRNIRICPECGYQYGAGLKEEEIMDYIEQERDQIDSMTSEEIDYNFEKVEEYVIDEVSSLDGDIQEFLDRREAGERIVDIRSRKVGEK